MLRISATVLDSFRLYCEPDQDWMTEDQLVASIRGEIVETPELLIGRAFDRILEQPDRYRQELGGYRCDGWFFPGPVIDKARPLFDPAGLWQLRGAKEYGDAVVVGKADYVLGTVLTDNKTTFSSFDVHKYADAYQWRLYCDMFDARAFIYNVFCLGNDRQTGEIELRSIERVTLYPYGELHHDCANQVARFVAFVRRRGLAALLEARQQRLGAGDALARVS